MFAGVHWILKTVVDAVGVSAERFDSCNLAETLDNSASIPVVPSGIGATYPRGVLAKTDRGPRLFELIETLLLMIFPLYITSILDLKLSCRIFVSTVLGAARLGAI